MDEEDSAGRKSASPRAQTKAYDKLAQDGQPKWDATRSLEDFTTRFGEWRELRDRGSDVRGWFPAVALVASRPKN